MRQAQTGGRRQEPTSCKPMEPWRFGVGVGVDGKQALATVRGSPASAERQRASNKRGCDRADGSTALRARQSNCSLPTAPPCAPRASPGSCIRRCPIGAQIAAFGAPLGSRPRPWPNWTAPNALLPLCLGLQTKEGGMASSLIVTNVDKETAGCFDAPTQRPRIWRGGWRRKTARPDGSGSGNKGKWGSEVLG